jgi:hypothetical protein
LSREETQIRNGRISELIEALQAAKAGHVQRDESLMALKDRVEVMRVEMEREAEEMGRKREEEAKKDMLEREAALRR